MSIITSPTNPLIKELVRLHTTKGRRNANTFLAEGLRTCSTILAAGLALEQLYVTEKQLPAVADLFPHDKIQLVSDKVALKVSQQYTCSGIIGRFAIPQSSSTITGKALVLDELSDPGNMGTLIRSAVAFGYTTIIRIGGVDPWSSKVVQASAGLIAQVHLLECTWQDLLALKGDYQLCALIPTGGVPPANITIPADKLLLIIGNEAHGIAAQHMQHCTVQMTIPMASTTESLNAAIAGVLAMYTLWYHQSALKT